MVKIIEMLIPKSNTFTRPGIKMKPKYITIHETDNTNVRANALAHAKLQQNGNRRQASWHLQVDDEAEVYQSLPFNEIGFHAGDGKGKGNRASIGIEICVNKDGNYKIAVANAIKVIKYLIKQYPTITDVEVVQHNKWSGKNCPRHLRAGDWGINWKEFIAGVNGASSTATKPSEPPKYETTNTSFSVGDTVKVKKSAKTFATGQSIAAFVKGSTYKVLQRGSNRLLLGGIMSWVKTSDVEKVESSPSKPSTNKPKSKPSSNKVTLKSSATKYATGETIPKSVKGKQYTVMQERKDQVLLKEIMSWVYKKDVSGYGNSTSTSTSKPKTLKVGSKVKIKSSASKYSRANVTIPTKHKNKSYTVQQVGKDDVLIKEIYSWVKKAHIE